MPRSTMISSVHELDGGREPVDEVVMTLERPVWSFPVSIVVFVVVWFAVDPLDLGAVIRGALAGAALGLALTLTSTRWLLAGTPTRTLLVRSKTWVASAAAIEAEYPRGVVMTKQRSFINTVYDLDGRSLVVSRAFLDRLATIATLR